MSGTPTLRPPGGVVAAHATAILAQRQEQQLQAALLTRGRSGQAKGNIMATYDVDDVRAFEMLRRISQDSQTKLADIAQRVIDTRVTASERFGGLALGTT
jgi:AmiR/NasT family two-component response regulator